jgi:hypothetical protein
MSTDQRTQDLIQSCEGHKSYSKEDIKNILAEVQVLYTTKDSLESFLVQVLGSVECVNKEIRSELILLFLAEHKECQFFFDHSILYHHASQFLFPVYAAILKTRPKIPLEFVPHFVHLMQNRVMEGRREISPVITRVWKAQAQADPCDDSMWQMTWNLFKDCWRKSFDEGKRKEDKVKAFNLEDIILLQDLGFALSQMELTSYINFLSSTHAPAHMHGVMTLLGLSTPGLK